MPDIFTREIYAAVARLSADYTYPAGTVSEALARAREADADLDRAAEHIEMDLDGGLAVLRTWEQVWAVVGMPRTDPVPPVVEHRAGRIRI